jgi:4-hydroxybenzoate polyprenyltransferase
LFPGWWSLCLAQPRGIGPDIRLLALFAIGAVVMRGAGCTVNDIVDRDFDAKVARTANRPLPSGALSLKQAYLFLALQLAIGLVILLQFLPFAIFLGAASLILVATYPFMKRITWWPQAFLGLTFNWGALLGWAVIWGSLAAAPIWLYVGGIFWTLFYDTLYAHQDKEDDVLIGVKSTALKLGENTKPWLLCFAVIATICFGLSLASAGSATIAYLALAAVFGHMMWQLYDVDIDDAKDCLKKFRSNRFIGWILLFGILLDRM